jgi:hypothetical protein
MATLRISGVSLATLNSDLATLTDTDPTTGSDTITVNVNDSFGNRAAAKTIAVTAVNGGSKVSGANVATTRTVVLSQPPGVASTPMHGTEHGHQSASPSSFAAAMATLGADTASSAAWFSDPQHLHPPMVTLPRAA